MYTCNYINNVISQAQTVSGTVYLPASSVQHQHQLHTSNHNNGINRNGVHTATSSPSIQSPATPNFNVSVPMTIGSRNITPISPQPQPLLQPTPLQPQTPQTQPNPPILHVSQQLQYQHQISSQPIGQTLVQISNQQIKSIQGHTSISTLPSLSTLPVLPPLGSVAPASTTATAHNGHTSTSVLPTTSHQFITTSNGLHMIRYPPGFPEDRMFIIQKYFNSLVQCDPSIISNNQQQKPQSEIRNLNLNNSIQTYFNYDSNGNASANSSLSGINYLKNGNFPISNHNGYNLNNQSATNYSVTTDHVNTDANSLIAVRGRNIQKSSNVQEKRGSNRKDRNNGATGDQGQGRAKTSRSRGAALVAAVVSKDERQQRQQHQQQQHMTSTTTNPLQNNHTNNSNNYQSPVAPSLSEEREGFQRLKDLYHTYTQRQARDLIIQQNMANLSPQQIILYQHQQQQQQHNNDQTNSRIMEVVNSYISSAHALGTSSIGMYNRDPTSSGANDSFNSSPNLNFYSPSTYFNIEGLNYNQTSPQLANPFNGMAPESLVAAPTNGLSLLTSQNQMIDQFNGLVNSHANGQANLQSKAYASDLANGQGSSQPASSNGRQNLNLSSQSQQQSSRGSKVTAARSARRRASPIVGSIPNSSNGNNNHVSVGTPSPLPEEFSHDVMVSACRKYGVKMVGHDSSPQH